MRFNSKIQYVLLTFMMTGIFSLGLVACGDSKSNSQETSNEKNASVKVSHESQNSLEEIKNRGVIRIGVFSDKPPFGYTNKDGKFDGFDIYIAKRFAKDLLGDESKVEFLPVEAAARLEYLKANKVDVIMANFTQTPERSKIVDFAKPYMKVSLGVVSKNGEITSEEQLYNKTLIVNKGTTADMYFSKKADFNLLKFDQNTETFQAFLQGKGEALSHDSTLLFAWVKDNPAYKVGIAELGEQDVIAPAVKKGNQELLEWLNAEIDTLLQEGFFIKAYKDTLSSAFGNDVKPEMVIFTK